MRRLRCRSWPTPTRSGFKSDTLRRLITKASQTRFGRDHRFGQIRSVADFQRAVPIRTYEALWDDYLRDAYPVFENLTWPGRIPFLALTSGTTQGATKYIPVSAEMVASNRKAAQTMLAFHLRSRPESRLFHGRIFFLGGSTDLERAGARCFRGRPEWDRRRGAVASLAALHVSSPGAGPGDRLGPQALSAGRAKRRGTDHPGERRSELAALALSADSGADRQATLAEVWPQLELVVHGGVKFDPYREAFQSILGSPAIRLQETYPCSEGFIAFGDPATGLLRLVFDHGMFYEFVPVDELDSPSPTRHWLGTVQTGVNYAIVVSTCAGMWAHVIGDTIRFESLVPPLITFTGRTGTRSPPLANI